MSSQKPIITVRYYRNEDKAALHRLFRAGMTQGVGSPVEFIRTTNAFKPLDRLGCTLAGMAFSLASYPTGLSRTYRCALFLIGVLFSSIKFLFQRLVASSINSFVDDVLKDDFDAIPRQYGLVPSESGEGLVPSGINCFWVAEARMEGSDGPGELVGAVGLDETSKASEGLVELRRMVVSPNHRRLGIAQKLITALIEHARARNLPSVYLNSSTFQQPAIDLYKKFGCVPVRRKEMPMLKLLGLKNMAIIYMLLDLKQTTPS